ncbi:hypothetical protein ACQY0O_006267 [Thecaphora frezii]
MLIFEENLLDLLYLSDVPLSELAELKMDLGLNNPALASVFADLSRDDGVVASSDRPALLLQLPIEVLGNIWCHLSPVYLSAFSRVCKRFHAISKDPYYVAMYFLRNHYPHSIWRAICHHRNFSSDVFRHLIRGGAPFSRSLVQQLGRAYFGHSGERGRYGGRHTNWGTRIPFDSCLAVMQHGFALFGNKVSFAPSSSDEREAQRWVSDSILNSSSKDTTQLRRLLEEGRYLPLPFCGGEREHDWLPKFAARYPNLVPLALKNGWVPTAEERDHALRLILLCNDADGVHNSTARMLEKVEQLCEHEYFEVTPSLASDVFTGIMNRYNNAHYLSYELGPTDPHGSWSMHHGYEVLTMLDARGMSFGFSNVVESNMLRMWRFKWHKGSLKPLQRVARDYPQLRMLMATPVLLTLCGNLQADTKPTAEQLEGLECVDLTETTVANVLLSPQIRNAAVLDIAKAKIPAFDREAIVCKLLPKILCQPCRGEILDSLHKVIPGFAAMLENALMAQDFYIQDLATPSEFPKLRQDVFKLGHNESCPGLRAPNAVPVRSVLSYDVCHPLFASFKGIFTNFWRFNGRVAPGYTEEDTPQALIEREPLFGLESLLTENGDDETKAKALVEKHRAMQGPIRYSLSDVNVTFTSSLGDYGSVGNRQSLHCLHILGRASPASSLLLSHAIVNDCEPVLYSLLQDMRPLSFDLGHWKLLSWLGRAPPRAMYECIAYGAPFSSDGSFTEHPQYDAHVLNSVAKLSTAEKHAARQRVHSTEAGTEVSDQDASAAEVPPKFNAARDRRHGEAELTAAKNSAMDWSLTGWISPAWGTWPEEYKSYSSKIADESARPDDAVAVRVGYYGDCIYLNEEVCRRRLRSITEWIDHLQGLLLLERKLKSLESHVRKHLGQTGNARKTEFHKALERKSADAVMPMLKATQRSLQQAVDTFDQRALSKRANAGDIDAEIALELEELQLEFAAHGEAVPESIDDGPRPKRECTAEMPGRHKSKRLRVAEDSKYEDSEDENFDPDEEGSGPVRKKSRKGSGKNSAGAQASEGKGKKRTIEESSEESSDSD